MPSAFLVLNFIDYLIKGPFFFFSRGGMLSTSEAWPGEGFHVGNCCHRWSLLGGVRVTYVLRCAYIVVFRAFVVGTKVEQV